MGTTLRNKKFSKSHNFRFLNISKNGQIEPIFSSESKDSSTFSPQIQNIIKKAAPHFESLGGNAESVFIHNKKVLRAATEAKIIDPCAGEDDTFSLEIARQIFLHSLSSESYFPTNTEISSRTLRIYRIQRKLNDLDSSEGNRSEDYVRILNDPSIDSTELLIALYTRIADLLTVHDPEATMLASNTRMPGIFPVYGDWDDVKIRMSKPMLDIYCHIADWGGLTRAYRGMRDLAIHYNHPKEYEEVSSIVTQRMPDLKNTNKFILELLKKTADRLDLNILIAENYYKITELFSEVHGKTIAVALRPFKGVGGLLHKSQRKDGLPVEKIKDWTGATAIAESTETVYQIMDFLHSEGMRSAANSMNFNDTYICEPMDYISSPKGINEYQSGHCDHVCSYPGLLSSEIIVRTLEMHKKADEGEANHSLYKGTPLHNGEQKRFKQALEWMRTN